MKKQRLTKDRIALCHDVDGVHTDKKNTDINSYFYNAGAQAVSEILGLTLPFNEMADLVVTSYHKHDLAHTELMPYVRELGLNEEDFKEDFYRLYHEIGLKEAREKAPHWFEPCEETNRLFDILKNSVRHGITTQGHFEAWTKIILEARERLEYFDKDVLIDHGTAGYENTKERSPAAVFIAMLRMGVNPEQMVFVEDTPANLATAKRFFPEVLTVLISDDLQNDDLDFVDLRAESYLDFQKQLTEVHTQQIYVPPQKNIITSPRIALAA